MQDMDFRGRWLLVKGASAGLGREIARQLAREHGANLILLARRADRLAELRSELEHSAGVTRAVCGTSCAGAKSRLRPLLRAES